MEIGDVIPYARADDPPGIDLRKQSRCPICGESGISGDSYKCGFKGTLADKDGNVYAPGRILPADFVKVRGICNNHPMILRAPLVFFDETTEDIVHSHS